MKTVEIPLTQGKSAIIDECDFEVVRQHNWMYIKSTHATSGYAVAKINKRFIGMHRLIINPSNPTFDIDHKDGNGLNNTRDNLRICTVAQNRMNSRKRIHVGVTSLYKGVHKVARCKNKPWRCELRLYGKKIHLGYFADEREAARAYDTAAMEYFGEFARLNFPLATV